MKYIFPLFIVFLFVACGGDSVTNNPPDDATTILKKEVMKVHDETMTYMTEMRSLKKKLMHPDNTKDMDRQVVRSAIDDLAEADSLMMAWMKNYKEPKAAEELEAYLKAEMVSINRVDKAIKTSIKNAKSILGYEN